MFSATVTCSKFDIVVFTYMGVVIGYKLKSQWENERRHLAIVCRLMKNFVQIFEKWTDVFPALVYSQDLLFAFFFIAYLPISSVKDEMCLAAGWYWISLIL